VPTNQGWEWCLRENATYLDCPISNYDPQNFTMGVVAYNPATLPINYVSIAVPHGNINVQVFNKNTKKFENNPNVTVLNELVTLENGYSVNNSWLVVNVDVDA
jgi:hypothetical protein